MSTRSADTILVIEPDEALRSALRAALSAEGFAVYSTADAEAGFAVLLSLSACACIVLNAEQTGLSAVDFIDRSRSYVRFHRIPLVVVGEAPAGLGLGAHVATSRSEDTAQVVREVAHLVRRSVHPAFTRDAMQDAE
jgi:DNA-binding response OmpR family regulator